MANFRKLNSNHGGAHFSPAGGGAKIGTGNSELLKQRFRYSVARPLELSRRYPDGCPPDLKVPKLLSW
jgi:hypothetical protein